MKIFTLFAFLFSLSTGFVLSQEESYTFIVDDVPRAPSLLKEVSFDDYAENYFSQKVYSYPKEFQGKNIVASHGNGFLSTIKFAYNHHRPLELSPDVIWLAICQGFGDHVSANIDSMEFLLLKEGHSKEVQVRNDNLTYENDEEWSNLIASFVDEIDAMSKDEFKDLIVQEFSTTTPTIRTVYSATHLDVASNYVRFRSHTMCGFPSITILGTPDDWMKIYNKIDDFSSFGLEHWVEELKPVIKEFVEASSGNPNVAFWKSFYKTATVYDVHVISGWILKLYPYLKVFKDGYDVYKPNPYLKGSTYLLSNIGAESLPKGCKKTKITWVYGPSEQIKDSLLLHSGFFGIVQNAESGAIRPNITWVLTSESDSGKKSSSYAMYRQDAPEWYDRFEKSWNPELASEIQVKPIFQAEKHDSFEEGVQAIQLQLVRSGLFKNNDHPKIRLCIAHEGTVFIRNIENASEKQEKYIRELIESTNGEWSPALHNGLPSNFVFDLSI